MDTRDWLAERFEEQRSHLRGVAYRMLGSLSEADDAVQESWLRLSGTDAGAIDNLGGWLTTVVARVCLDMLRSRTARREESLDVQPAEPAASGHRAIDPEQEALMADAVGLALLVVLEHLPPAERLAFVLHDMFAVPFDEIAPIVGRSPAATRQLASRARRGEHVLRPGAGRPAGAHRRRAGRRVGRRRPPARRLPLHRARRARCGYRAGGRSGLDRAHGAGSRRVSGAPLCLVILNASDGTCFGHCRCIVSARDAHALMMRLTPRPV